MGEQGRMKHHINIDYDTDTGKLTLEGPVQDKVLVYGMLSTAKDLVQDMKPEETKIIRVAPKFVNQG